MLCSLRCQADLFGVAFAGSARISMHLAAIPRPRLPCGMCSPVSGLSNSAFAVMLAVRLAVRLWNFPLERRKAASGFPVAASLARVFSSR